MCDSMFWVILRSCGQVLKWNLMIETRVVITSKLESRKFDYLDWMVDLDFGNQSID